MTEDLFDPQPKDDPKALYGREKELADLTKHLEEGRWVVLLGPRRIGKTSLAKCAVAKLGYDSAVADARQDSDLAHALVSSLASPKKADASISAGIQLPAHIPLSAGVAYSRSSSRRLSTNYSTRRGGSVLLSFSMRRSGSRILVESSSF